MGYILTSAMSADARLIEACAKYVAPEAYYPHLFHGPADAHGDGAPAAGETLDDIRNALIQVISTTTVKTPEGWRALAAAADNAAQDGACDHHAAAMIFVMQCSLLGKRKEIRHQARPIGERAVPGFDSVRAPAARGLPPVSQRVKTDAVSGNAGAETESTGGSRAPAWDQPDASAQFVDDCRRACQCSFAPAAPPLAALPATIRFHETMSVSNDVAWESLAAWIHIMDNSLAPGLGRLHATA